MLQKLQDAHQVLQQKLTTDAKLQKQALAAAAKERHQLQQQAQELQQQLEDKDKEARANALSAKQAQQRLQDIRTSAAKSLAGVNAKVAEAVAAEAAKHRALEEARVHLMLCIIRDDADTGGKEQLQVRPVSTYWWCRECKYMALSSWRGYMPAIT